MKRWLHLWLVSLLLSLGPVSQAPALSPEEKLADPAAEERARGLSLQLRCLVCQNQSIDDSDAPFARDMRKMIRNQINAGQSDDEIITFLRQRYGDYVLLKPPFSSVTAVLWVAPFALLALGIGGVAFARLRRQQKEDS